MHLEVVDFIDADDTEQLEMEQDTLDGHDDDITSISLRLQQLIVAASSPIVATSGKRPSSHKLSRLEHSLKATEEALAFVGDDHLMRVLFWNNTKSSWPTVSKSWPPSMRS